MDEIPPDRAGPGRRRFPWPARALRALTGIALLAAAAGFGAGPLAIGWLWPAALFSNLLPPIAGLLVLTAPVLWLFGGRRLALVALLPAGTVTGA